MFAPQGASFDASWVRERTASFRWAEERWLSTVCSLR